MLRHQLYARDFDESYNEEAIVDECTMFYIAISLLLFVTVCVCLNFCYIVFPLSLSRLEKV